MAERSALGVFRIRQQGCGCSKTKFGVLCIPWAEVGGMQQFYKFVLA